MNADKREETLTVKKAAAIARVHINTIYGMVSAGKLRAYRVGIRRGTIRICRDDFEKAIRWNDDPPTV